MESRISKTEFDDFALYRASFSTDTVLWSWLFQHGHTEDALEVLAPMVRQLLKHKQYTLLGRYAHNLGVCYSKLGQEQRALALYTIAYRADQIHHGKAAKDMQAYQAMQEIKGSRSALWRFTLRTTGKELDRLSKEVFGV